MPVDEQVCSGRLPPGVVLEEGLQREDQLAVVGPVVRIERGQHEDLVLSPASGRLGGVLGQDGEPVKAGQAVAWMEQA